MSGKSYGNKNEFIYQYIHIADGRNFIKFPLSKFWLSNDRLNLLKKHFANFLAGTTRFVETPPHEIHVKIPSSPFNLTWTFNFSGVAPKLTVTSNKNIQLLQYTNTHGRKGIVVLTVNHQKDLIESLGEVLIAVILIQSSGRMFVERSVVTLYISTGNHLALGLLQLFRNERLNVNFHAFIGELR